MIFEAGIVAKASFCQIILHILHFARFPVLIFKINFAISTFGNFLRNVHLKGFHFKHRSHSTESVLMAIIFSQTKQNHFELFSCHKVSNILPMQNLHNTFLLIFFISDLIRDEKICILLSTYFSTLMRSDMVLTSDFNFPFVTSTPFSMCFAVDVETTHSKRILSFFVLLNFMNGTINGIVFLRIFWRWKTYNCQRCTFWSSSFLKEGSLRICQHQLAKKNIFFFKNKSLFLHYKCCTYQNISFFLPSGWNCNLISLW